ncbi:DedA family protein [Paenibacillus flagellatus]|uniref:DedA family protein n=1 Tax=Paenibacillus flagellatus TaxID=2211139 RepID=A0A2V5JY37_9BACL|nr:DedA family protein [Paenibacillus flagellatus]PYI51785.1 DedA family protein [Paenibacillus flagellatus]
MEWIGNLFEQYGYFVLFFGLFAESMALPFPGELAMAVSGHLSTLGISAIPFIIAFSYIGAIAGTTLTYYLGYKLGTPFFDKYGKYVFMNKDRIAKVSGWFDRYGDKLIFVSYFIPGLRHFTGYVSGILKVRPRTFFIYNFIGGLLWVIVYVSVGVLFGKHIETALHAISRYSTLAIIALAVAAAAFLLLKRHRAGIASRLRANGSRPLERSGETTK